MAGEATLPDFDLPEEVLSALPADPFEQLDVARKITSIALASRISGLESEVSVLRLRLSERDDLVAELCAKLETLEASLSELSERLAHAQDEKETLLNENASLTNTVKKLNRDVSRLEIFKKTLMQSLQEDDDSPQGVVARVAPKISETASFSSIDDEDTSLTPNKSSLQSQLSVSGSSAIERVGSAEVDGSKESRPASFLSSLGGTPRLTPPGSPPRRHSISVATTRNMFDDRSSVFSLPSSHQSPVSSPFDPVSQTGRTRVDGKEFFRQVRSRLSYEQFSAFLSNVKELNAHKQSREETLRKAGEIFGPDNKDLYTIFEGLITRNLH